MGINLDEGDLKQGVLSLVLSLVEIIKETLELQSVKRMESGRLTEDEIERLGLALRDLSIAIEEIKVECGIEESVAKIRNGLDSSIDEILDQFVESEGLASASSGS
ncbi:MAG: gas vesicle protein K [Nitrososphaerota archaeon]|nr:gas vesicle protein K [Nitrososphaerota archaeon]